MHTSDQFKTGLSFHFLYNYVILRYNTLYNACSFIEVNVNSGNWGGHVFTACDNLKAINVAESNKYFCSVDGVLYNKGKNRLIKYPDAKTETTFDIPDSVTCIERAAFYGASLQEINIPDKVSIISSHDFSGCSNLNH